MKRLIYFVLLVSFVALTGCSVFDAITGVNPDGTTSPSFVDGVVKSLSGLPGVIGWIGTLGTGLFGLYKTRRAHQLGNENANYNEALTAVVTAIDKALVGGTKLTITKEELYAAVDKVKNEVMTNPQFLTDLVALIKSQVRKPQ